MKFNLAESEIIRPLAEPRILVSGQEKIREEPECTQAYMRIQSLFLTNPETKRQGLCKRSIHLNVGRADNILAALKDETVCEKQKPIRAAIQKQFFTVDEEPPSKKIVRIFMEQLEKEASWKEG